MSPSISAGVMLVMLLSIAGCEDPTDLDPSAADGGFIFFATDWSAGDCSDTDADVCVSNGGQWVTVGGNYAPPDIANVFPADSPAAAPWRAVRPGTTGRVFAMRSDQTSNGGINGFIFDSGAVEHWFRFFIYVQDSVQTSVHPVAYQRLGGGFAGVTAAWSHLPNNPGAGGLIRDSMYVAWGVDGTLGGPHSSGIKGVGYQRSVLADTWYCVTGHSRHRFGTDWRHLIEVWWQTMSGDTVVSPQTMLAWADITTSWADELASPDSMDLSAPIDTTQSRAILIAQEGRTGSPNPSTRKNAFMTEFAISIQGPIPCSQVTTTTGTTTN